MSLPSFPFVMSPTKMSLNSIASERRNRKGNGLIRILCKGEKNIARWKRNSFLTHLRWEWTEQVIEINDSTRENREKQVIYWLVQKESGSCVPFISWGQTSITLLKNLSFISSACGRDNVHVLCFFTWVWWVLLRQSMSHVFRTLEC